MPLSDAQITTLCEQLLQSVTIYVEKKAGPEAASYAGENLFHALRKFDDSRGMPVERFARQKTYLLCIESCRSYFGRPGTARHARNQETVTGDDVAESLPDTGADYAHASIENRDMIEMVVKASNQTSAIRKCILIGYALCGLEKHDLKQVLNVSETKLRAETLSIRELLPSH